MKRRQMPTTNLFDGQGHGMKEILEELMSLGEAEYADFSAKLAPTLPRDTFIGVRVPTLRKLAVQYSKTPALSQAFFRELPHTYYEENMLHAVMLDRIKDPAECLAEAELFLPYVDNWAVCDSMKIPYAVRDKTLLRKKACQWIQSSQTYTCRFGLNMLMDYFLGEDFEPEDLERISAIWSEEYYVRMMVAFYFATALAKQWDKTVPYVEQHRLDDWTHRKTIQKACESYRITPEQKQYLKTLK